MLASDCDHRDDPSFSARPIDLLAFSAGLAPCLIGIEACATRPHWARELIAPPSYVKFYL